MRNEVALSRAPSRRDALTIARMHHRSETTWIRARGLFLTLSLVPVCALGVQAAGAQSPSPDDTEGAKAQIAQLEDRWLKAIEDVNVGVLGQILADDFLRPAPAAGQFVTKTQLLDYYKSGPSRPSGSQRIENLAVTVYGAAAIARGQVVTSDASGRVRSRNLFTDVFVRRGGSWQAVSAQENDVSK